MIFIQKLTIKVSNANITSSPISMLSNVVDKSVIAELISMDVSPETSPCRRVYDALSYIKDCHRNGKCIAYQINGDPHFHKIFKEHPCINIMHVIAFCQHGDQFITQDKGYDDACNRHDDRIRQSFNHTKDTAYSILVVSVQPAPQSHLSSD